MVEKIQEIERPKQASAPMEFYREKGNSSGIFVVVKERYQPAGFVTKFNKDGSVRKVLTKGRHIKTTVYTALNRNYRNKQDEAISSNTTVIQDS